VVLQVFLHHLYEMDLRRGYQVIGPQALASARWRWWQSLRISAGWRYALLTAPLDAFSQEFRVDTLNRRPKLGGFF
jgi:hypothetical protein